MSRRGGGAWGGPVVRAYESRLAESAEAGVLTAQLGRARVPTESVLAPLSAEQLTVQVSPLMSPLVWDYAHIGHFEELWLARNVGGRPPMKAEHDDVYDAFARERSERGELPILPPDAADAHVKAVRKATPS